MKSLDVAKLDELCTQVVRELEEIGGQAPEAVAAEIGRRMETLLLVSQGLCLEPESLAGLERELAAVEQIVCRLRGQSVALLAQLGVTVADDAPVHEVRDLLSASKGPWMRTILHQQLAYASELATVVEVQLKAVRSIAVGPKHAMSQLEEALAQARKLLQEARSAGKGS